MAISSADMLKSTQPGVVSGHLLSGVRVSSVDSQDAWQVLANTRGDVARIEIPADPQARVAFVRRWMAKNQKALKSTGMAATLVLPLMAQQAFADQKVAINDLQGVAEVIRMPDGSLTLLMNNGYRIDLAAADVALEGGRVVVDMTALMEALGNDSGLLVPLSQLPEVETWELMADDSVLITRPDGSQMVLVRGAVVQQGDMLLISPSNALQSGVADSADFGHLLFVPSASFSPAVSGASSASTSSSAPVSSFADIPPWLYIAGGAVAVGAAAAGGGGGGGGGDAGPATISGYVIDGYISGATVTREFDANSVTTDGTGFFSGLQGSGIITATGGIDISTGLPFTGVLRAPDGSTVITPLTTMMVQLAEQFEVDDSAAQTAIKTALGLDSRLDLMTTDPLSDDAANIDLLIAGVKVASLLAMAATAGISHADALSLLGAAFNQASEDERALTNQEMADALGLPSIAGQVKQALDAIDQAGDGLNLDAYRDGASNPLRDAQQEAQDQASDLSDTIAIRADIPYLTLQEAVDLAQNGELPAQYLINPDQLFAAGTLGLTAAGNQLALVETLLAGDFDVATVPIALGDIYTWSVRADAEDVLVSGGLGRPEVVGAQSVTLTNATIRPDQFADLNTLDNFDLGSTVVPYTLEEALATNEMPANYTLNPSAQFSAGDLTVREAAELIDNTRALLDLAQNTDNDNLTRDLLLEWNIVDSLDTILGTPAARPQIAEANSISVTEAVITPAQFVQLNALVNFVLGDTEVDYTLAEALDADPLASNYIIDLQEVLNAGTVTVAQAETDFADVSRVLEGANNQPPLTLFVWEIRDTAEAIIADLGQAHVIEANQVSVNNRVITSAQFDQLNSLENFELGTTIVRYTLEQAVSSDSLAANYEIDTETPFNAGSVSVADAEDMLAAVERILADALNPQTPSADELFNWSVLDTAEAILAAGDVSHMLGADVVNVSNELITLAQYQALIGLESNYVRTGETVEYTLAEAMAADDSNTLLNNYAINVDAILEAGEVTVAEAREAYTQVAGLVANAENSAELRENLPLSWRVVDNADTIIADVSADHVTLADQVRVTETQIVQAQYEALQGLENFSLADTVVSYTLEGAVATQIDLAENYILTNDVYDAGELSVDTSRTNLERVDDVVAGAGNVEQLDADTLFNWTIVDSVTNVLNASDEAHLARADLINVNNPRVTIEQFLQLKNLANYERSGEWVEYTLEQAYDLGAQELESEYAINESVQFTPEPLTVESAIADLATVQALIDGAENTVELATLYRWSVLDSYTHIQAQIGADLPDGIRLAESVQVTETVLTAEQYEVLVNGLDNFDLGSTADITYADMNDALRAESVGVLAPTGRFSLLDDTTAYAPGELSVTEAAEALASVRTVLAAANGLENSDATVQALFDWTVEDTAENIIQAINQGHVTLADDVLITDQQITYAQYQALTALDNYDYASSPVVVLYTLEEALGVIDEEGVDSLDRDGGDDSVGYRIGSDIFTAGTFTAAGAQVLVSNAEAALSGANPTVPTIEAVLQWEVEDSSANILATRDGTQFPDYISGAELVSVTDDILTIADFQRLDGIPGFELGDTPVRFIFTQTLTLQQIQNIASSYEIEANASSLPSFALEGVESAAARYAATQSIVDGALNRNDISVEELQTWSITNAQPDNVLSGQADPWVVGAESISLALAAGDALTPEQYEAFIVLGNVDLDDVEVRYSLEEALALIDDGGVLPEQTEERPGSYQIDPESLFNASALSVDNAEQLLSVVEMVLGDATNADELDRGTLLSWVVEDSAANIIAAIDSDAVLSASSVRVNTDEIGYLDFEALSELNNFDQDGLTVSYPLGELVARFLSGGAIPVNYALDTDPSAFFNAGALDAKAAERLFETATSLIDGAVNSEVALSSLTSWTVQDTYENIYTLNVTGNGGTPADFLISDAASIVVIDDPLEGDAEQDLNLAFTVNGYTHQPGAEPGGSIEQLSKTFIIAGQPDGEVELITDFRVGNDPGFDELFIELTAEEFTTLRGDGSGFNIYGSAQNLGIDEAFVVFTTESFTDLGWLDDLGLEDDDVVYLLANEDASGDNAQLFRVEDIGAEFDTQALVTFENLDLNSFLEENWNTNYSFT
ncbi:calcium-binding protein [Vreelandella olivaria]|uniref:calcium-binding protein n=1 Tax=Vreelandella olivaria TaxID=390919 RepID=UPI00201E9DD1|nr:calcium-binding protein [Halomonas olivaria]